MKLFIIILSAIMLISTNADAAERESYYSDLICDQLYNGARETLPSGLRPDCQTEFAIIEFDWATQSKLYECIGQALIYSHESGKTPVCVLLARDDEELLFGAEQDLSPFGIALRVIDTRPWDPVE